MSYPYRYVPKAEVLGATMSAIFNNYRRDEVLDSLKKHGAHELDADKWYPVDLFIDIFKEWLAVPGASSNVISVGMALVYHIDLPDELENASPIEKLMKLGELHVNQHRHGNVGTYQVERLSDKHLVYTENMVWPDDLIYGYLYGACMRYLGQDKSFTLSYDATHRQDMGENATIFHLVWD